MVKYFTVSHSFHYLLSSSFCFLTKRRVLFFGVLSSTTRMDWCESYNKSVGVLHPRRDKPREFCCTGFSSYQITEGLHLLKENEIFVPCLIVLTHLSLL